MFLICKNSYRFQAGFRERDETIDTTQTGKYQNGVVAMIRHFE